MVRNPERRTAITDAGIALLAADGARGLTFRAVDVAAGLPVGTTTNYFRSRTDLVRALADRIGERLTPEPDVLQRLGRRTPDDALFADYMRDIVRRLTADRQLTLALYELRLEGARRPEVGKILTEWFRAGFEADVAFNATAGLPGRRREIALFHYAIEGLVLDRLTQSIDPETSTDEVVDALVDGLVRRG